MTALCDEKDDEDRRQVSSNNGTVASSTPFPLTRRQKIIFFSLAASYLCNMMSFSILAPFYPIEAEKKGVSTTATGFIFGSFNLIIFFTSPLFGKYVELYTVIGGATSYFVGRIGTVWDDKNPPLNCPILPLLGAKFLFLAGSWLAGGSNILFGCLDGIDDSHTFLIYCFVIRFVEAIGVSAAMTAIMTIASNTFPDRVAQMIGLLETFSGAGFMIGPPLGGLLYSIGGYRLPFIILGSLSLTMVLINMFLLPQVGVQNREIGSVMKMLQIPAFYPVALGIVVGSISLVFLDPTLSVHLSSFDISPSLVGVLFLLFGGFYGATSPLWGCLADKKKNTRTMMIFGYFALSIAFVLVGPSNVSFLPNELWVVIIGLAMVGLALGCALMPAFLDLLSSAVWHGLPDDLATQGVVSGLFSSSFSLGAFVGPTLGSYMVDLYGFRTTSSGIAGLNIMMMLILCLFSCWEFRCGRGRRPPWKMFNSNEDERRPLLHEGRTVLTSGTIQKEPDHMVV